MRALVRHVRLKGARVIDVGCGDGRLTRQIAGVARSVVGIDPNRDVLASARRLTPPGLRSKVRYRHGTAEHPGTAGARFDVAVFSGSL